MLDVDGLEEGEFDPALAAGQGHGDGLVPPEGVALEVELKGTGHTLEGLGTVRGALELAVGLDQGAEAQGDGVRGAHALLVEGSTCDLETLGEACPRVEVDGGIARLPVLEELPHGFLRAGTEGRDEGTVDDSGEVKSGTHEDPLRCRFEQPR